MAPSTRSTWNVDASHSSLLFSIRHLVIARVRGRFSRFGGAIELDEEDLTRWTANVEIDVTSIDTSLEQRDAHLRSADFLDVERFPTATFTSTSITRRGEDYDVSGAFTLRGVTRDLALKATFGGTAKDARGRERIAFGATTAIDRAAFGVTWNQVLEAGGLALGPTVDLEIDLQAIKA